MMVVDTPELRNDVREFLTSRRAKITPQQAGLPAGRNRRVPGLRRTEVASLAGMSVEYYSRLERGNLAGVSEEVLESLSRALELDEAEAGSPPRPRPSCCLEANPTEAGPARVRSPEPAGHPRCHHYSARGDQQRPR